MADMSKAQAKVAELQDKAFAERFPNLARLQGRTCGDTECADQEFPHPPHSDIRRPAPWASESDEQEGTA